ncbi:MAG TPA: divalent-cation tolerance protein CutA [Phycicoccus sp.]
MDRPGGSGAEGSPAEVGLVEVHLTAPDAATAERLARLLVEERLARLLVEERLAACVQVVPGIRSWYRWEGRVTDDAEHLLLVKSTAGQVDAIGARVRAEHPYDTPEVLVVPVVGADSRYSSWLRESVDAAGRDEPPRTSEDAP